jgi:hypothetical protein
MCSNDNAKARIGADGKAQVVVRALVVLRRSR